MTLEESLWEFISAKKELPFEMQNALKQYMYGQLQFINSLNFETKDNSDYDFWQMGYHDIATFYETFKDVAIHNEQQLKEHFGVK